MRCNWEMVCDLIKLTLGIKFDESKYNYEHLPDDF